MSTFDTALAFVLKSEGGYVDDAHDPGGETNMGITDKRDGKTDGLIDVNGDGTGDVPVKELTREEAAQIYRREYWDRIAGDKLPADVALIAFDTAVNMGTHRAIEFLQNASGVAADGSIGPVTIAAASKVGVLDKYADLRAAKYKALPTFPRYGKGWLNRLDACVALARKLHAPS